MNINITTILVTCITIYYCMNTEVIMTLIPILFTALHLNFEMSCQRCVHASPQQNPRWEYLQARSVGSGVPKPLQNNRSRNTHYCKPSSHCNSPYTLLPITPWHASKNNLCTPNKSFPQLRSSLPHMSPGLNL